MVLAVAMTVYSLGVYMQRYGGVLFRPASSGRVA
jgi:hypothetical protein